MSVTHERQRHRDTVIDAFAEITSSFDKKVPCLAKGKNCQLPARWWINTHGCESGTICTRHLHIYVEQVSRMLRQYDSIVCDMTCGKRFTVIGSVFTAVPI